MRVLLDENLPRALKHYLQEPEVTTASEMRWSEAADSDLLRRASEHFDVLVTADRNLEFQQHLTAATIGIVIVTAPNTRIQTLQPLVPSLLAALNQARRGTVTHVP